MNPPSPPLSIAKKAVNVSYSADPRIPAGAWDSHLHIMDPVRYPPVENIPYKPAGHNLWENAIFENSIGCDHVFFVQTATHGYDLTLMLDSMRAVGKERALGLALFDPNTTSHERIRRWDSEGVRAVRVNLVTYGDDTPINELKSQIKKYVDLIKPFDWVLQLYTKMERIAELEDFLPTLGVRVVFDHYGNPSLPKSSSPVKPYDIEGFQSLVHLLKTGTTWVKISGTYRLSHLDSDIWEDLDPVTLELFEQAPKRVVFGSDWTHTRFEGLDVRPWVSHLLDLTEGKQWLRERLFRDNALELWGVNKTQSTCNGDSISAKISVMFPPRGITSILAKAPSDVVVLSSLRTPICRANRGSLKDAFPEALLGSVLKATIDRVPSLDPSIIEDVAVGVVLSELGGSKAARMAMNHVGYPNTTSLYTVNRACSSSLQAISSIACQIRTGMISVGIGAGMESMTRNYGSRAIPTDLWPVLRESPVKDALDCILPMGTTSENVAERFGISREDQDAFCNEIVPVTQKQPDGLGEVVVDTDDGIRPQASLEGLAKLKPVFREKGTSTAGNSSQVSDGAAATLLMRRSTANELDLGGNIMGKFVSAVTVGCAPDEMGVGPAIAIPKLLDITGLTKDDIHRWEINEAFASQATYCLRKLDLERAYQDNKVNPNGGAIALGHPLGATGARLASTLLHGGELGIVSMCIGTGMGMAGLFVRE
ncbi:TIM barrel metal-dependent hydrolase [Fusarium circinatum]|uniref:acetyl-CoA C-acyltransferase n=1 Tax=Fusarium circinatum TaxID=48490 RepID=A0A8H5U185_FUSCI|nr:TIM barrel metal-dependent hydrolase [Fusarium circinatum]